MNESEQVILKHPSLSNTIFEDGLFGVEVGKPVSEAGHGLKDEGVYEESCRMWISNELPGVTVLVEDGIVQRVSAHQGWEDRPGSTLKTAEGISVGDPLAKVRAAYPRAKESPHKYTDGLYLDWLPGGEDKPGLRFEVTGGIVTDIHAGQPPVLFYIEGCS